MIKCINASHYIAGRLSHQVNEDLPYLVTYNYCFLQMYARYHNYATYQKYKNHQEYEHKQISRNLIQYEFSAIIYNTAITCSEDPFIATKSPETDTAAYLFSSQGLGYLIAYSRELVKITLYGV